MDFATKLGRRIESEDYEGRKLKVFFAPWDIRPGENVVLKLNEGLSEARYFILVLSPDALTANWPVAEQAAAIYTDPAGRLGRVISILRRPCSLPPLLRIRNYVDFTKDSEFDTQFRRLLSVLTGQSLHPERSGNLLGQHSSLLFPRKDIQSFLIDDVREEIFSNLFSVVYPGKIFSAPTKFFERKQVYAYFDDQIPPAFILKHNRLYAFVDLNAKEHPFKGAVEDYEIQSTPCEAWLKDSDRPRWFIELLNDSFRVLSFLVGLKLDKKGKKSYFPKGVLASEKVNWKAHQKTASRHMIKERKNDQGQTVYFVHRAVDLRFILLGSVPFLRCETGRVFSRDGTNLIEGRRRSILSTRLLSRQRNLPEFDDTRFWIWLLSEDGNTMKLDFGRVAVSTRPISVPILGGIYGDLKVLPEVSASPPDLIQEIPEADIEDSVGITNVDDLELEEEGNKIEEYDAVETDTEKEEA